MKKVLIIGTGLGGLATALRLAKQGYEVEMVEKYKQAGGRLNQLKKDAFCFDMAPSFFSMTYIFDSFFRDCRIQKPFVSEPLDPLYSVHFSAGNKEYIIYKDIEKLAGQFKDIEADFERKLQGYLRSSAAFFHDTENRVIKKNYDSVMQYLLTLSSVPIRHFPKLWRNFWQETGRYFVSDEVRQILSLVAFFLGATPFDTPALYTLLSYVELQHDGYHNIKGGMYSIVEGLLKELELTGVRIHYNTHIVESVENNKELRFFRDQQGRHWEADLYVVNADAASFRGQVFKRKKFSRERLDKKKWTLAPLTIYLGIDRKLEHVALHNYYLGSNMKEYASKIFKNRISLQKPYYYLNIASKYNPDSAPKGCESLFILCPVPDLRYKPDWSDRDEITDGIISDLSDRIGVALKKHIISKTVLTPADWEKNFGLYRGSGLGLAHDLNQIGGFRPKNFDEKFTNVFYVGSSTVPGTGLPMAIISSQLAAERIFKKYGTVS
jgi:phytoene desaturase